MSRLFQLIYISRFVAGNRGALSEMRRIVSSSRVNNYRDGLTGCLLFDREIFVQALEGPESALSLRFDAIRSDPRHIVQKIIQHKEVPDRSFPVSALAGFVRSNENESIFRRHRFSSQKSRGRFSPSDLLLLGTALVAREDYQQLQAVIRNDLSFPRVRVVTWQANLPAHNVGNKMS